MNSMKTNYALNTKCHTTKYIYLPSTPTHKVEPMGTPFLLFNVDHGIDGTVMDSGDLYILLDPDPRSSRIDSSQICFVMIQEIHMTSKM